MIIVLPGNTFNDHLNAKHASSNWWSTLQAVILCFDTFVIQKGFWKAFAKLAQ